MREIMTPSRQAKIWRYMDLAKFISLLSRESLYFACPREFNDLYEGYLPKSHLAAIAAMNQKFIDEQILFWKQIAAAHPDKDLHEASIKFNKGLNQYIERIDGAQLEASSKFGISCWHKNDYESEAMWRLYQKYGLAIESTIGQLHDSILDKTGVIIEDVRYMDFDNDPIEKGHKHYALFIKRRSFEHEKELRATILLQESGKGIFVKCNLDTLINRIHISPYAESYIKEVVESLCACNLQRLNKPVSSSPLFDAPNYNLNLKIAG